MGKFILQACFKGLVACLALACSLVGDFENGVLALRFAAQNSSLSFLTRTKNSEHECLPGPGMPCAVYQPLNCPVASGSLKGSLRLNAPCRSTALGHSKCVGNVLLRREVSFPFKCLGYIPPQAGGLAITEKLPRSVAKVGKEVQMKRPSLWKDSSF